jgi:molybdopterin molybdotransferase
MSPISADWLDPRSAAAAVIGGVRTLDVELRPLGDALGSILAEDLLATIDVPRWTNSAMDGFAVHAADVADASKVSPVVLPIVDDIAAGQFPRAPLGRSTAARVMTGAPVPEGADTVIRVEHTDGGQKLGTADASVSIFDTEDTGRNLRRQGEDLKAGNVAVPRGSLVSAGTVGVELDRFDEVVAGRRIVSSNSYTLSAQLKEAGCDVRYLGIAADTRESLRQAIERADGCDALVTSAGVSVGEHDHVKDVLIDFGAKVHFWRVRMRPGSPFAFGQIAGLGGIPWFGLPGNPVSSMVTFELFARPGLLRMAGRSDVFRTPLAATLREDFSAPAGLTNFVRVRLSNAADGTLEAHLTGPQGSGILTSLAFADGLMVVGADKGGAKRGEVLPVLPFGGSAHFFSSSPAY